MHRRYQLVNIPIEVVRTLVVIAESGSYAKAGERLGLSQPAITAQIKRLQVLIGGQVFDRVAGGVVLNERGKLTLTYARRLLDANDQILAIGGSSQENQPLRVALAPIYIEQFLAGYAHLRNDVPLSFHCENSPEIAKGLIEGYLDCACLLSPPPDLDETIAGWKEKFVWVRSDDFALSPGAPIPIVMWPGGAIDASMVKALEKAGLAYRVAFSSADLNARLAAVVAGIGITQLPQRYVKPPLRVANEYYLPPLDCLQAGVVMRPSLNSGSARMVADLLCSLAPENMIPEKQIFGFAGNNAQK